MFLFVSVSCHQSIFSVFWHYPYRSLTVTLENVADRVSNVAFFQAHITKFGGKDYKEVFER